MSFLQPLTSFELYCLVGRAIWGKLRWRRGTHRWNLRAMVDNYCLCTYFLMKKCLEFVTSYIISLFYYMIFNGSNADATCNFYPCESVIYVQFPCATKYNRMIDNNHGDRWSRGCPIDDEFSGFYVIDGIKGNNKLKHSSNYSYALLIVKKVIIEILILHFVIVILI